MIDVGGPVDAARRGEELRARRARSAGPSSTSACSTSCGRRRLSARRGGGSRRRRSPRPPPTRRRSPRWFGEREPFPRRSRSRSTKVPTSRTARTRTSAPPTTPSAARAGTCSRRSSSCTAASSRFNNLHDLDGGAPAAARVRAARVRDRQAREPVRRRASRDDRGGVRARARLRPALGVRRRLRRSTGRSSDGARRAARGAVRRGAVRARLRGRRRSRRSREKPATRILVDRRAARLDGGERDLKRVLGGLLVQDRDSDVEDREGMEVVCGDAHRGDWGDLLFAWRVCKHVASNAIVLAKDLRHDRDRSGPAEPRRRGPARAREGARARPRPRRRRARLGRVLPVRGRAASSRSTRASPRSSSRAARSATTR